MILNPAPRQLLIILAVLFAQACVYASSCHAAPNSPIYVCTDEEGRISVTNVPSQTRDRKCKRQADTPLPVAAGAKSAGKAATPSPADFPKVGAQTQKARDDLRRRVLTDELAGEQRLLDQANLELAAARSPRPGEEKSSANYLQRVSDADKAVQRHRANIDSLQREIGKLK